MRSISMLLMLSLLPCIALSDNSFSEDFDAIEYVKEQAPEGVLSQYRCPKGGMYSFDDKTSCRAACYFGSNKIFDIGNVELATLSRSSDRVAIVVDLFGNEREGKGTDTLGSFASDVSCVFKGLDQVKNKGV